MTDILNTIDLIGNLEKYRDLCDFCDCSHSGSNTASFIEQMISKQHDKDQSYMAICSYYSLINRGHYANLLLTNFSPITEQLNKGIRVNIDVKARILKQLIQLVIKEETDKLLQVNHIGDNIAKRLSEF